MDNETRAYQAGNIQEYTSDELEVIELGEQCELEFWGIDYEVDENVICRDYKFKGKKEDLEKFNKLRDDRGI